MEEVFAVQKRIREWREELLLKPLMAAKMLSYPKEIEVCSKQGFKE